MTALKVHTQCWEAPGTFTACGLFQRNFKVTMDFEKVTCFRCRQIVRLLDQAGKPAAPSPAAKAPKRVKYLKPSRLENQVR